MGRVFNSRSASMHAMYLLCSVAKLTNLELKIGLSEQRALEMKTIV
jgi:hypothetical protein